MPARLKFIELPLSNPVFKRAYQGALERVLKHGKLILGPEVAAFEKEFTRFCGARECVAVGNGTDALQIALRLSGVNPGGKQEVITTPLTASFTAHAIVAAGGRPVFADIDPGTLLIATEQVAASINSRTAAVLPVHLYGQACDLNALRTLAARRKVALVQDAAQAHGTLYRGEPLAKFSDLICFSFYPTKNLGALGDGGALVTNSAKLAEAARLFRDGGRDGDHSARTEAVNSRLDELQAAFLQIHLQQLRIWNERRKLWSAAYDEAFDEQCIDEIRPVARAKDSASFPHLYVVRVQAKPSGRSTQSGQRGKSQRRKSLMSYLAGQGIETGIHYERPLHLQPAFGRFGYRRGDFPNAELACDEILSLPMHPFLSRNKIQRVVKAIGKFFRK